MDDKINQPPRMERSISRGCKEGFHAFNPDNSMMGVHNGVVELRFKCSLCGVEIAEPSPIKGLKIDGATTATSEEPKIETVEDTSVHEEIKPAENPYKDVNEASLGDPPWAAQVKSRYKQDKQLDDFFQSIKDNAMKK